MGAPSVTSRADRNVLEAMTEIAPGSGDAADEARLLTSFLPTPRFLVALDPDILLVLGERGTGKTALFTVLGQQGMAAFANLGLKRVLRAYAVDAASIPNLIIDKVLHAASPARLQAFWLGRLVHTLRGELGASAAVAAIASAPTEDARLSAVEAHLEGAFAALDAYDRELGARDLLASVCYDRLDVMMPTYRGAVSPVGALLAFWFAQRRRWRHLRPKVFLRIDLFDAALAAFPDGAKFFAGHQTELVWSRLDAWRMWVKRMANHHVHGERVRRWMSTVSPELRFEAHEVLGHLPVAGLQMALFVDSASVDRRAPDERRIAPLIYDLVGRYLGANARKGDSFTWIPSHVEDANGRLLPRPFLHVLRLAAKEALGREADRQGAFPMIPSDITRSFDAVSVLRLREVLDEDPWIAQVAPHLSGMVVPAPLGEWVERVSHVRWSAPSPDEPRATLDAGTPPEEVVERLRARGILERRSDDRFNVPEIYRAALAVKRKGGPSRG